MGLIGKGITVIVKCPKCKRKMVYDRCDKCGAQKLKGVKRLFRRVAVVCRKCGDYWEQDRCVACGWILTVEENCRF